MFEIFSLSIFYYTGSLILIISFIPIIKALIVKTIRYFKPLDIKATYGSDSFAVITGATSGIGLAFTNYFIKEGLNIVAISRDQIKLQKLQKELIEKYPLKKVLILTKEFTKSNEQGFWKDVENELKSIDVSILINNVGICYTDSSNTDSNPYQKLESVFDQIPVNITSAVCLTRILGPSMIKRGKGCIINVASIASFYEVPNWCVYSATKAALRYFSININKSLKNKKVDCFVFNCGFVETNLANQLKDGIFKNLKIFSSPDDLPKQVVDFVGIFDEGSCLFTHELQAILFRITGFVNGTFITNLIHWVIRKTS